MPQYVNDQGTVKKTKDIHVNDNGTVKSVQEAWVNDRGTVKQYFTAPPEIESNVIVFGKATPGNATWTGYEDGSSYGYNIGTATPSQLFDKPLVHFMVQRYGTPPGTGLVSIEVLHQGSPNPSLWSTLRVTGEGINRAFSVGEFEYNNISGTYDRWTLLNPDEIDALDYPGTFTLVWT